jgi:hypothetical protein
MAGTPRDLQPGTGRPQGEKGLTGNPTATEADPGTVEILVRMIPKLALPHQDWLMRRAVSRRVRTLRNGPVSAIPDEVEQTR